MYCVGTTRALLNSDHNNVAMIPDVIFYDNPLVSESRYVNI